MLTLDERERMVVEAYRQLSPERRRAVLLAMAGGDAEAWKRHRQEGEVRLRRIAAERGIDWDALGDAQKLDFVNDLMHEDD